LFFVVFFIILSRIMKRVFVLLALAAAAFAAALTDDCKYVYQTEKINPYGNNMASLNFIGCYLSNGELSREELDAVFNNLDVIRDTYVFADVANAPNVSNPRVDFANKLNDTKYEFYRPEYANPSKPVAWNVFDPVMKLINSLHDGHVSLTISRPTNVTNMTVLSDVVAKLPFQVEITYHANNTRSYKAKNPDCSFFSSSDCDYIKKLYTNNMPLDMIDSKDPYEFLTGFIPDEYNWMRSEEGRRMLSMDLVQNGIPVLRYPMFDLNAINKEHSISITEYGPYGTFDVKTFKFKFAFINKNPKKIRDVPADELKEPITIFSQEQEKKNIDIISKFEKRHAVRAQYVPCETVSLGTNKTMNYMTISSFAYEGNKATQFLNEVQDCIAKFEKNDAPITVILPHNTGGSYSLALSTMYLLMPSTDFRSLVAMRHNDATFDLAARIVGNQKLSQAKSCRPIETFKELYQFWEKSETDDLGGGVSHVRTPKLKEGYKDYIKVLAPYALNNHTRKPTEIFLLTDGYCLDACAKFVQTIVHAGAGTTLVFGPTLNKGSFTPAMYASGVIDPSIAISSISNNAAFGINLRVAVTEDYAVSESQSDAIPLEYQNDKAYKHIGYYLPFDTKNMNTILGKIYPIYEDFNKNSKCDASHPKLLLVNDDCKLESDFVTLGGYACGTNGQWDKSATCKAAACEGGYVVDFETGKCVPNSCDSRYVSPSSSSSASGASESTIDLDSATIIKPVMALVAVALVALFHLDH